MCAVYAHARGSPWFKFSKVERANYVGGEEKEEHEEDGEIEKRGTHGSHLVEFYARVGKERKERENETGNLFFSFWLLFFFLI